jgi:hypothetical protein
MILVTLHLVGVEASESLAGVFFLFVLIDPFAPVDLYVLVFFFVLDESGPEGGIEVFLFQDEEHVETCFVPLGLGHVDFFEEFKGEAVLLLRTFALEGQMGAGEFDLVVEDVHETEFYEDFVFSLGPFEGWVAG